jgi:predicted Zn-dependent peptidase
MMHTVARTACVRASLLARLFALSAGSAAAQDALPAGAESFGFAVTPSGLRCKVISIPGATHVGIVAAVRVGTHHDPEGKTGLTHLLNALIALGQEPRPEAERFSVKTTGPATVLAVTCPAADWLVRVRELARLLAGEQAFDDDLVARARAVVLKEADEYLHMVPGPLLFETARRSLFASTPAGKQAFGVPAEIAAISEAELRAWFEARVRPEHTTLVVLGGVDAADGERQCAEAFGAERTRTPPATPTVHDSAGPVERERPHPRVAAPFVTVALAAPPLDSRRWLPFVIAMHVVDLRCHTTFGGYRGGEAAAMFPFFWFDYRHGDRLALINRRGLGPDEARPGEAPRDLESVRGEMRAMIKRLRTVAPELGELRQAAFATASMLMLPPYERQLEAMAQNPGLLMPRAELLAMADVLGLRPTLQAEVGKVALADVQRELASALADENLTWFALLPER